MIGRNEMRGKSDFWSQQVFIVRVDVGEKEGGREEVRGFWGLWEEVVEVRIEHKTDLKL